MADFGYSDPSYRDIELLSRGQAQQSVGVGERAAQLADPYAEQRKRDIESLRLLESNPGSITTSPFYQFLINQQLDAVRAKNAGSGNFRSTRGAMNLMDRAAGVATQAYFPLLNNLTARASGGSSPTAASVTYERGMGRSQDQSQMAAAAKAAGRTPPPAGGGGQISGAQEMMNRMPATPSYTPAGSFGMPYGYDAIKDPMAGYTPSADAGTGYVMSDQGVQGLNGPGSEYYSFGQYQPKMEYSASTPDYGYDNYGEFGYGDGGYGE